MAQRRVTDIELKRSAEPDVYLLALDERDVGLLQLALDICGRHAITEDVQRDARELLAGFTDAIERFNQETEAELQRIMRA